MKLKIFFLIGFMPFLLGYKVFPKGNTWDISRTDPYLYLDFCADLTITENDVDSTDILSALGPSVTSAQFINEIANNYNSVTSQYARLAVITDPSYNPTAHANRIITVCEGQQSGTTGFAQQEVDSNGKVIGCAITLGSFSGKAKAMAQVITHEIGHCLGLDHPQETKSAIMSYFSNQDEIYRLQGDDKAGLTYLYPTDPDYKRTMTLGASCSPQ